MANQCRKRDGIMRINKEHGYAIKWLVSQGKSPQEISEELGFNIKQIKAYIKNNIDIEVNKLPIKSSSTSSRTEDLMIRHTSGKKNNTVAIMTKEASEVSDSLRPKLINQANKNQEHIFKPR